MLNERFQYTKTGKFILNENNTLLIMEDIIKNNITNVRHYFKCFFNTERIEFKYKKFMANIYDKDNCNSLINKYPKLAEGFERCFNNNVRIRNEKIKESILVLTHFIDNKIILENGEYRDLEYFDILTTRLEYFDNLSRTYLSPILDELYNETFDINLKNKLMIIREMISVSYGDNVNHYEYMLTNKEILQDPDLTKEEIDKLVDFMNKLKLRNTYSNFKLIKDRLIKQRISKDDLFKSPVEKYIEENRCSYPKENELKRKGL